MLNDTVKLTEK